MNDVYTLNTFYISVLVSQLWKSCVFGNARPECWHCCCWAVVCTSCVQAKKNQNRNTVFANCCKCSRLRIDAWRFCFPVRVRRGSRNFILCQHFVALDYILRILWGFLLKDLILVDKSTGNPGNQTQPWPVPLQYPLLKVKYWFHLCVCAFVICLIV